MHALHPSTNITQTFIGTALLCFCSQVTRGQDTQTFLIHGTARSCSAITQLDSALTSDSQQFFASWTEKDYADALAWSQACSEYGWHIPGRPRIPLLQAQHDRALGSAQAQSQAQAAPSAAQGSAAPIPAVMSESAAQPQTAPGAAQGSAAPIPAVVSESVAQPQTVPGAAPAAEAPGSPAGAAIAAQAQAVSNASTGSAVPIPAFGTAIPAQAQTASSAAVSSGAGSAVPIPAVGNETAAQAASGAATGGVAPTVRDAIPLQPPAAAMAATGTALPTPGVGAMIPTQFPASGAATAAMIPNAAVGARPASAEGPDSLLTDDSFKKRFHQESLWVASKARLDIGEDRGPASWTSNGTSAQLKNRLTADRIVLYCAKKTNSRKSDTQPLFWDWRWCETEEASAYSRLVSGNEFPMAGRDVLLGCADADSYIYFERCVQTVLETEKQ